MSEHFVEIVEDEQFISSIFFMARTAAALSNIKYTSLIMRSEIYKIEIVGGKTYIYFKEKDTQKEGE